MSGEQMPNNDDNRRTNDESTPDQLNVSNRRPSESCPWTICLLGVFAVFLAWYLLKEQEVNHHELRLMMLGKSGTGKSASANTILGEETFRVEASPASVTHNCEFRNKVVHGRNVTIIDTPGQSDTWEASDSKTYQILDCIFKKNFRPHVFLLVIRLQRFTREESKIFEWLEENFGEEALDFTMILFTGGDLLEGKTVDNFINQNAELYSYVTQCKHRYHVFNNYDKNNQIQVIDLLRKIDKMLHSNSGYTNRRNIMNAQKAALENMASMLRQKEQEKQQLQMHYQKENEEKNQAIVLVVICVFIFIALCFFCSK